MQEGFVPFKDDKSKDTEISPFKAGSNYYHQAMAGADIIINKLG